MTQCPTKKEPEAVPLAFQSHWTWKPTGKTVLRVSRDRLYLLLLQDFSSGQAKGRTKPVGGEKGTKDLTGSRTLGGGAAGC